MTSTVTILETVDRGDVTKIVVEVKTDEIFSVEGERLDSPDRGSDYHQGLHGDRVNHKHNRRTSVDTIWMANPYTQADLDNKIQELTTATDSTAVEHFEQDTATVQERMFVDGVSEKLFYEVSKAPHALLDEFTTAFPAESLSDISLISTPSHHNLLGDDVISTFRWEDDVAGLTVDGVKLIARSRKYCMTLWKKYDRCYTFANGETFTFLPDGCTPLAKSFHTNLDDGLVLPDFYDVYFSGDAATIEAAFELPPLAGTETTYYAVTVVDGKVKRAKQYCYDSAGAFYDWSGTVVRAAESHGVDL